MANSVNGFNKRTKNVGIDEAVWNSAAGNGKEWGIGAGAPGLVLHKSPGTNVAGFIDFELVKNPNDGSEAVLASGQLKPSDWSATDTSKTLMVLTAGTEGDNGSTATQVNYYVTAGSFGAGAKIYALRLKFRGHTESDLTFSAGSINVKMEQESAGNLDYEIFLSSGE